MVRSTRRPASHERSLIARRSGPIPAWVGVTSSATGLSAAPAGATIDVWARSETRDRDFGVWSLAIRSCECSPEKITLPSPESGDGTGWNQFADGRAGCRGSSGDRAEADSAPGCTPRPSGEVAPTDARYGGAASLTVLNATVGYGKATVTRSSYTRAARSGLFAYRLSESFRVQVFL